MPLVILGISAFYHDSAAVLLIDGEIIAAAQEERFTRIKHDSSFPQNAVNYVLQEAGLTYADITSVAFYDKPLLKFERLLETYHAFAPKGLLSFVTAIPLWLKDKLFIKGALKKRFSIDGKSPALLFPEHHLSHTASAYYPSPYQEAAILTVDGVGEWATTTICHGRGKEIRILMEQHFPHSVGLLYAAFTYYLGFKINEGEYKVMGLASYGNPESTEVSNFKEKIKADLVDIRTDGSILLNMKYFEFATELKMTNNKRWAALLSVNKREPDEELNQQHINLALAIQQVTEEIMISLARTAKRLTNSDNVVMAGGVALNCVANSRIQDEGIFKNIWIQPAAGDAGGALGAAYAAHHIYHDQEKINSSVDLMKGAYLGPGYDDKSILNTIKKHGALYEHYPDFTELATTVSELIADGKVIGWFQGRMEFGPRALGNRSILGDARNPLMQSIINRKIKFREDFRPFAPCVLEEDTHLYFKMNAPSPYMLFVKQVNDNLLKPHPPNYWELDMYTRLAYSRSTIPAVTHVDYSARVQTVNKHINPKLWQLLSAFKTLTGDGLLVNTSFNVKDEPIVCTPEDAYQDFLKTGLDVLVLGNYLLKK
ncbi:carbamoyltransferase [Mucilaginibacter jinjuensis]|uniref:Carbamoyltransferase n=1 Tax=Mucilaginibacter jinjuensis TaxID=1176721 RepID=A0ABY7T3W9_9SPHI|nr:carbamoyltransferase [Mucilaginibacter jinjuensis]WCT10407.1 carbamoyltransferase [Mucilaginibacter jinjuensis]